MNWQEQIVEENDVLVFLEEMDFDLDEEVLEIEDDGMDQFFDVEDDKFDDIQKFSVDDEEDGVVDDVKQDQEQEEDLVFDVGEEED